MENLKTLEWRKYKFILKLIPTANNYKNLDIVRE